MDAALWFVDPMVFTNTIENSYYLYPEWFCKYLAMIIGNYS